MEKKIKKMEYVSIRDVWKNEASDFTPWLKENLDYLNEVLGIDLEPEETEVPISEGFHADLTAIDSNGNRVIIENQFGKSDHDHLGKLLTYCINLNVKTGIWICEEPRQSHIEVIDNLNEIMPPVIEFYLIKLKVGKVDESYIPQFEIKSEPSKESKIIGMTKKKFNETELQYLEFWEHFLERSKEKTNLFANKSPGKRQWISIGAGKTGIGYCPSVIKDAIRADVYIDTGEKEKNKKIFDELVGYKDGIEEKFGKPLEWERLDNKRACRIRFTIENLDWQEKTNWDIIQNELIDAVIKIDESFKEYIKILK